MEKVYVFRKVLKYLAKGGYLYGVLGGGVIESQARPLEEALKVRVLKDNPPKRRHQLPKRDDISLPKIRHISLPREMMTSATLEMKTHQPT